MGWPAVLGPKGLAESGQILEPPLFVFFKPLGLWRTWTASWRWVGPTWANIECMGVGDVCVTLVGDVSGLLPSNFYWCLMQKVQRFLVFRWMVTIINQSRVVQERDNDKILAQKAKSKKGKQPYKRETSKYKQTLVWDSVLCYNVCWLISWLLDMGEGNI